MADQESPARPIITAEITRGTLSAFVDLGFAPLLEFSLSNGRRADVCGLNAKGEIAIAEVKSGPQDYLSDLKWREYRDYCDYFYFAVAPDFPLQLLPSQEDDAAPGIIYADKYGGAVFRASQHSVIAPARRKAITLSFARLGAFRLTANQTQSSVRIDGTSDQQATDVRITDAAPNSQTQS